MLARFQSLKAGRQFCLLFLALVHTDETKVGIHKSTRERATLEKPNNTEFADNRL